MKSAEVYSVRAHTAHGFAWKWRSLDKGRSSSMSFVSHEDCVADAQKSGYVVTAAKKPPR